MQVRAKDAHSERLLRAATDGDIEVLQQVPNNRLLQIKCNSGCSILHWAAGSGSLEVVEFLVLERQWEVDLPATKKSRGRTPLHYASRNGCLQVCKWLVEVGGATVDPRAKHGVTPFQLAVWQNQLEICQWLVEEHCVNPAQLNDFDCGAVHWIGLCPIVRANINDSEETSGVDLLPLAKWLDRQPGVDFGLKQKQGHTPMHKAAWGGHLALLQYLRDDQGLLDEHQDDAGNFAADLADMANTPRHTKVAQFLRATCSKDRAESCAVLGVDSSASNKDIRKAYLKLARQLHPDRRSTMESKSSTETRVDFDRVHTAYEHLIREHGKGNQRNPSHSLNLMLAFSSEELKNEEENTLCFRARLTAVVLEYGDKGLSLGNVVKKWKQVWPKVPFPDYQGKDGRRKVSLSEYISAHAGDVVRIEHNGVGDAKVYATSCSRESIQELATRYP